MTALESRRRTVELSALWETPLRRAMLATALWRLAVGVWGVVAHGLGGRGPYAAQTLLHRGWPANPWSKLIDAGVRMDAWWYARIALHGYGYSTRHLSSIVFFPLYPGLVKAVSLVTGNVYVAGMLLSTGCLFLSVYVLQQWLNDHGMGDRSALVMGLLLCFPFGFFWASMYGESLFLLLTVTAFVACERGAWGVSAGAAFLAVLTRPTGLIIAPCLALLLWRRRAGGSLAGQHSGLRAWSCVLSGPLAYLLFAGYQWLRFGTPLASIRAEAVPPFSRDLSQALSDLLLRRPGFPSWYLAFMLGIALVFLAGVPVVYRRFGPAYALFAALAVLFPLASGLTSMERYVLIDFPVFAAVATIRPRVLVVGLMTLAFYALLAFMTLFIAGYTLI